MFNGIHTALVTPLLNGAVDVDAAARLARRQVAAGVHGLVVCASTGEGMLLSEGERRLVLETVVRAVEGRCPVTVGISAVSTWQALEQSKMAADCGASAIMVAPPPYVKPGQDAICAHMTAVADQSRLPIMLYNVPSRSGVEISFSTAVRLSMHSGIVAIKEASGSLERVQQLLHACAGRLSVLSGDDALNLSVLVAGGSGVVSTSANAVPEKWVAMWNCVQKHDIAGASAIQMSLLGLNEALFLESNPGPVKAAMRLMGLASSEVRSPLFPPARPTLYRVAAELENLGIRIESGELV